MSDILIERLNDAAGYELDIGRFRLFEAAALKITELEKERDDFEALNSELYSIIFTHLGWWNLEGANEIDHDDIIKALKEQGE